MIRKSINWILAIPAVVIDGGLYVTVAMILAMQTTFTSEEAYKYVAPYTLFWIKATLGTVGSGLAALKMFRSSSYADHIKEKETKENETPKV